MQYRFKISGVLHESIKNHLFPGDGKEAVGIILCGQHYSSDTTLLLAKEFYPIKHELCDRGEDFIHWKTELIIDLLLRADKENLSIVKIHSHPGGYDQFSWVDDEADRLLFPSIHGWTSKNQPHGSSVLLPDGMLFGRVVGEDGSFEDFDRVSLAAHEIKFWSKSFKAPLNSEATLRNRQTLGDGTASLLASLKIGVVGASGTGSPTIEQLSRLGVGEMVICDPDVVEFKNINRILNTFSEHALTEAKKVDVIAEAVEKTGMVRKITPYTVNLYNSPVALHDLASCDVIFGCMDSVDGRHLLNQLATFYLIPYFDIGIKIEADGLGGIDQINGVVHYLQPGCSSLLSRGCYSIKTLEAAGLKRKNPEEFDKRQKEKYIINLPVDRPAVISINMQLASVAINEFLDRIHRYKGSEPSTRSSIWVMISEDAIVTEEEGKVDEYLKKRAGRGDVMPFLEMPELTGHA